ncbi:MAG: pirin family protein [Thermoplasmatota archaeon]
MALTTRAIVHRFKGEDTMEGAGVRLRRQFGNSEVPLLDPFLLLDNFGSTKPADYLKGFPWHPHRGMETVTYMLSGRTDHEDSLGNKGTIGPGEVQWMSAGSGIMHQEMPQKTEGLLSGLQLWVNVPHTRKMDTPAYRGVTSTAIPIVKGDDGSIVKVIAGTHEGATGPVRNIAADPVYVDVTLPPGVELKHPTRTTDTVFAHVIEGTGCFDPSGAPAVGYHTEALYQKPAIPPEPSVAGAGETLHYGPGDQIHVKAGERGVRFLLVSGQPLHEPVAWYGPIVMNTRDEILTAVSDLQRGTFIRTKKVINEL